MIFTPTPLAGGYEITLTPFSDSRGWFARFFCRQEFEQIGHSKEWMQMNHSFTSARGAVRGMHFQYPPFREVKLVRCISGAVFDVMVDLRQDSPSYLQWYGAELSAERRNMLYIPEGFAHGFQTLTENCELIYLHTALYQPKAEGGIRYDDPALNIQWPLPVAELSERDKKHSFIDKNFKGL
ncbi:dTDP-4-dehydrorhamnose 3,5-epimerase [Paraflavisolibacter sp. H34]|uniref:dTDP-4-dehydrorhamnose 3,5-epimerase n=1 Tax=Huijunlia imazamoxiresistens TaxID=3127457 RepID=UPI0030196CAB